MTTAIAPETQVPIVAAIPARAHLFRRLLGNPMAATAIGYLALIGLIAIVGRWITPSDPNQAVLRNVLGSPSGEHWLGGDSSGRDVFSRLIVSTQTSVAAALLALVVALVLGVGTGLVAGYYGGRLNSASSWVVNMIMALPGMVVLLAARAVLGPSVWLSMLIFGILLAPAFYRLVVAAVSAVREELYVDAAKVSGLSDYRIITRHILSVVRAPIIILSAMILGIAIAIQSGLEFLGLGDINTSTWGSMLNDGFSNIYRKPMLMLWPTLAIALTCVALVLLANAMRDELERTTGMKRRRKGARATAEATAAAKHSAADVPPVVHPDDESSAAIAGPTLLEVSDLRVGYDQPDGSVTQVVHGVDLAIKRGEVHGLIGESGSGKTQTAFAVLGLLPEGGRVLGGSIIFEGTELANAAESTYVKLRGDKIAYVPQEPMSNLDPSFTIGSQLTEPLRIRGVSKEEAKKRALDTLALVGIPNPERTFAAYPHEISGGMAQRVLITGAVLSDPDLLIADEPTTALDVTVQAEVLDLLRDLRGRFDMGVLIVTHNFGVVADLCDRVSVMQSGRIVETGPVRAILTAPEHPYTISLIDAILEDGPARAPLATQGAPA